MPPESSDILPGLYAGFVSLVLLVLVTAVFVGSTLTAQGTVAAGALGSAAFGYLGVRRNLATPLGGARQSMRPWLWFAAWAAVGLFDGRYQPLLAALALTAGMALCHLVGGVAAWWRR